jgi:CHAT domain-containing protein/tetratricopeptide (TPR) repeat protein
VLLALEVAQAEQKNLDLAECQESSSSSQQNFDQAECLLDLGTVHNRRSEYSPALSAYQQALNIYRRVGNFRGEAESLYFIGTIYYQQGDISQAELFLTRSLNVAQQAGIPEQEWRILTVIGLLNKGQGRYAEALSTQQQALEIAESLDDPLDAQRVRSNIVDIYICLGEYEKAISVSQNALVILSNNRNPAESTEDKASWDIFRGVLLSNIGFAYIRLGQYSQAIQSYSQASSIFREAGNQFYFSQSLDGLGFAYYLADEIDESITSLEQALDVSNQINYRSGIALTLNNLGVVYAKQGNLDFSWESYQEALTIAQEINDRERQRSILSNIGDLFVQQNQPQLAILFYKRSVNITEQIRRDIQGLPIDQQQSYTDTVADTYRKLADLLLQQNRILEAQQVLDLLKVQEIQDYLRRGVRGSEQTAQGVDMLSAEQQISAQYDELIQGAIDSGKALDELEAIAPENRTLEQQQRVAELRRRQGQINVAFRDFLDQPDVVEAIAALEVQIDQEIDLSAIRAIRSNIQQDAVLLYPLVLDDRLELVVLSPHTPPMHYRVPVGRVELNRAISDYLTDLRNPNSNPEPNAQRLYNWLIKPIEEILAQGNTKTIIYAPDGQLRYIPLAALHDGNQWIAERFQVNYVTAVSLFHLNSQPRTQPRVLAGAFSEGRYNIQRGGTFLPFSGLPFAKPEVETIARLYPNTRQLIDRAFTRAATEPILNDYNIVHLATHAMFTTGSPEDSFILFGDGSTITMRDVSSLDLDNVDLVVLSSCQTAVSTMQLTDGKEILGFGYQIQETGARAAIASLWAVDDGGTEALMSRFYTALQSGNLSKTAALQQAQIALIQGATLTPLAHLDNPENQPTTLEHPYYWASFILIGNGL